jgi:hypothetical protein
MKFAGGPAALVFLNARSGSGPSVQSAGQGDWALMSKPKRRAFERTRQAIGFQMLQLLALPLATVDKTALQMALADIAES